jgi:aspartate racemase
MPELIHVGVVACSAQGAALCYGTISWNGAGLLGPHNHPEIPMHSFGGVGEVHLRNDCAGVAERMLSSSEKPWKTERLMEDGRLACAAERVLGVS